MSERPMCCGKPMAKNRGKAGSGNTRYTCGGNKGCGRSTTNSGESTQHPGYDPKIATKRAKEIKQRIRNGLKRFVITSAQNNTPVDKNFLKSLQRYCEFNGAELLVVPIHYKNVSLYTANKEYQKDWDDVIKPYLVDEAIKLGGNTVLRADIKIAATAHWPLSGVEPINGKSWTIFGHPQFAMEPVASPGKKIPKRMYTTGSITKHNYSQTKLGAKAQFHHVMGALVVEVSGTHVFIRQLNADSEGWFYDLEYYYSPDEIYPSSGILAITTGDEHVKFNKKSVRNATYDNPDSIVNTLRPEYIIRHDVLDGYAGSHHHYKDHVKQYRKFHKGDNNYRKELDQVVKFINETTPDYAKTCIVPSNHHDHLYKWLMTADHKTDHLNADLILELTQKLYNNSVAGLTEDPLEIYLQDKLTCDFQFLDRSTPFVLMKVDYSQHGDVGVNGSRGGARQFAKTVYQMVIGHSHGSRICKGTYQVGTSTGALEYEKGLGDHTNTHCIQYKNGKRTLIDIFNGKWRL